MIFDDFQKEIVENDYWNRIILYVIKYIIVSRGIIEFNRKRKKFWKHFSFIILIHIYIFPKPPRTFKILFNPYRS